MKKIFFVLISVLVVGGAAIFSYTPEAPTVSPSTTSGEVVLTVLDRSYAIPLASRTTLLEAMQLLAKRSDFTFTSREYPGLGVYIDSINGQKSEGGKYWIIYINGTVSAQGVSSSTINPGDLIEWKYEKGY